MRFKNKWLNRVTATVLTIGMALTPAVMNSGVTYADVKDIESPIPVTQSTVASNFLSETITLGDGEYDLSAAIGAEKFNLTVGENGLITKATRAREEYKKAAYFEELNLDILDEQTRKSNNSKINCQKIHIQKKDLIL